MLLLWKRLDERAEIPQYAHQGDSGFDFKSLEPWTMMPYERKIFKTGLACEIQEGHELQIRPRSGLSAKTGLLVKFGTVDSGYRGEIGVIIQNCGPQAHYIKVGDRIAQGVICPVVRCEMVETDSLAPSVRAQGGFGSTGT